MNTFKKVAGSVAAAVAVAYAGPSAADIPSPGALGNAFLHFTNFRFSIGDQDRGTTGAPIGAAIAVGDLTIPASSAVETATTTAQFNGVDAVPVGNGTYDLGETYAAKATLGPIWSVPGSELVPVTGDNPTLTPGAGGFTSSTGDSRIGTAEVYIHSVSALSGTGSANSSATQLLGAEFTLDVDAAEGSGLAIELAFNLERFIRAALGQDGKNASAGTTWSITVTDENGDDYFVWTPNGSNPLGVEGVGGLSGSCISSGSAYGGGTRNCSSFSDQFTMQNSRTTLTENDRIVPNDGSFDVEFGYFEAEVFLPNGLYTVSIVGSATTNAEMVPEPATLALLGIGLLGLGVGVGRRRAV